MKDNIGVPPCATELRRRIRRSLPDHIFQRTPGRALLFLPLNAMVVISGFLAVTYTLPWYFMLLISLILGQIYATLAFLAHDVMHGSVVEKKWMRKGLAYLGFYPFLISPYLWHEWHVRAHHGKTNSPNDPDVMVDRKEYHDRRFPKIWLALVPCSRNRVTGIIFFLYWFTAQAQHVLWGSFFYQDWGMNRRGFQRKRAIWDTLGYLLMWGGVAYILGAYNSLFIIVLPMMIGNAIIMAFIMSQHTFRPRCVEGGENHPLNNTVSVRVPAWVDFLNINFSNHVEHHLFPTMSYQHLPKVRQWLRENVPEYYLEPTLWQAMRVVFNTPRVYDGESYLCYPDDPDSSRFDTSSVAERFREVAR